MKNKPPKIAPKTKAPQNRLQNKFAKEGVIVVKFLNHKIAFFEF
jgi:hypothetical protein